MPRKPSRIFTARHMADGVRSVAALQQHVLQEAPASVGPLQALMPQGEEQPEMLKGHCHGCKTKKEFAVEGEEKMKNGAIRKYGKCTGGCGGTISMFVAGTQDANKG